MLGLWAQRCLETTAKALQVFTVGTDKHHMQVGFTAALPQLLLNIPSCSDLEMCARTNA